jgi:hypothetical protein
MILTGCSGVGLACEVPTLMVIPSTEKISETAVEFYAEWTAYKAGMQEFVACTQAALQAAGGNNAPALTRAVLIKRNNDAVEELTMMGALYDKRVAPLVKENPAPALDIPLNLDLPE